MRNGMVLLVALFSAMGSVQGGSNKPKSVAPAREGFTLAWADEFDQPDNSAPDPAKWKFAVGGNGWGNEELEYYTSRSAECAHTARESRNHRARGKLQGAGWGKTRLHFGAAYHVWQVRAGIRAV